MSDTPAARPLVLAAPMLGYACNQKGCCCKGWLIPFKPRDLARLASHLSEDERNERLGWGIEVTVDPDSGDIKYIELARTAEDDACRFLEPSGGCEIHRRLGTQALPDLCVTFPVVPYAVDDQIELHYEALCPSVLAQIADPSVPYLPTTVDADLHPEIATRVRGPMPQPQIRLGDLVLSIQDLRAIRASALASLTDLRRPAIEHLAALSYAFDRVRAERDPAAFAIGYDEPLEPFYDFLEWCARVHASEVLMQMWQRYRRFVWDFDRDDPKLLTGLAAALDAWEDPLQTWMADQEEALRPLLVRYLAHRYHSAFTRVQGEVIFSYGSVPLVYALAIRLAAALSGCLERPTDAGIMKAALGWAEYTWRGLVVPPGALPWFTPFSAPDTLFSLSSPEPAPQGLMGAQEPPDKP